MLIINMTVILDQQLPVGHINHKSQISPPSNLFTPHTSSGACDQNVTNSIILSHHLTNITLSRKAIPQIILSTTSGIHSPFMSYDISYDYILNIIARSDMVMMDRFFLKHSCIPSHLNCFPNLFSLNHIHHGP